MDAIDLLQRYLEQPLKEGAFFDPAETVPLDGVVLDQCGLGTGGLAC
ncbi:hypothetical protein J7E97_24650 [Streptomyces sp. ISL-66]|nr:hypothetical protein [Streptomyces sp. ISL-66]MBT2470962.1 hypothetical protein [Streptomyces sp. ISL-66]